MTRHVLTVDLKDDPGVIATYLEYHRHIWPEVAGSLRAVGVERMEIFLLGRRLVMIVETEKDLPTILGAHVSSHPRVAEWEALMKSMQEPVPDAASGEWWAQMRPVFRLA